MYENGQLSFTSVNTGMGASPLKFQEKLQQESKYKKKKKLSSLEGDKFKTGRWTHEEHQKFVEAIFIYGNDWKVVQKHIGSRTSTQARSHAQKFLIRLKKKLQIKSENDKITLSSLDKLSNDSVQSCIKEFISSSSGALKPINRENLFKVILSFSNLLYFKSKKKEKKLSRFPILESEDNRKCDVESNFLLSNSLSGHPKKVFLIEKVYKKTGKLAVLKDEINILADNKTTQLSAEKILRKKRKPREIRSPHTSSRFGKGFIQLPSQPSLTNIDRKDTLKSLQSNNSQISCVQGLFCQPNNLLPMSSNNCIQVLYNINVTNNNYFNSSIESQKPLPVSNPNIYDNMLHFYNKKQEDGGYEMLSGIQGAFTSTSAKLSNASTLGSHDGRSREEDKVFRSEATDEELNIMMPNEHILEELGSLFPKDFAYSGGCELKVEEDAFEKFFELN